jgi:hypothetical protein
MPEFDGKEMTEDEIRETLESMTAIFVRVEDGEVVFYSVDKDPMAKVKNVEGLHSFLPSGLTVAYLISEQKPLIFDRSFDRVALMSEDKDIIEVCRLLQLMIMGGDNFETRM